MADKVQIGIIGVGQIGKNHLRRYADMSGVVVVAAADFNAEEFGRVAEQYGITHKYASFSDLLARDDIIDVGQRRDLSFRPFGPGSDCRRN